MRSSLIIFRFIIGLMFSGILLTTPAAKAATLNGHTVQLDDSSGIIPWTTYDQVLYQAWDYLLHRVPNDSQTGKPAYFSRSYLWPDTQLPADWPHNPAGLYSMLTESALKYYAYSGNIEVVNLAVNVATAQLNNGMTPNDTSWKWPNVPYASGDSGSLIYHGASYGDSTGRGDGTGVIEPDKLGEMGNAWLELYRFNGNTLFLNAAIAAADSLVSNVRDVSGGINETKSPWPFRVYAQTGVVREEYCANVIGPIRLFDGLIGLGLDSIDKKYQSTRQIAWDWLMAYPMQNNIWANYFEDVWIMPDTSNTNQYNAMMTARYLLEHPDADPQWSVHVPALISWVEANFAEPAYGANTIAEQMQFHFPMGSHTSRYASVNAMLYEKTGNIAAKEKAYRALNWATYMARAEGIVTNSTGVVIDGPLVNTQWFTDGYGDYIRHFMTSFGAVPEWAPAGNHLLRSSSLVKNVTYLSNSVSYTTSDSASTEVLRLAFTPTGVTVDGQTLNKVPDLSVAGWTFDPGLNVLRVRHDTGTSIQITSETLKTIPVVEITVTTRQSAGSSTISSPSFSTVNPNELLLAFIASDGPNSNGAQRITTVTGGSLTWTLRSRANAQAGTSEIWQALATDTVTNMIVTATRATGSYQGMMTIAAFQGASEVNNGAVANASAASGAPRVSLTSTKANSVVWGVGNDWDRAVVHTVSADQTKLSEYLAPAGDTFWVQYLTAPVAMAGVTVAISCTAPTNDRWNLAAIEIVPDSQQPTLSSIAVTPASLTIMINATQQYTAIGTYSDGSTQNITGQTTWASSNPDVATITSAGLVTARGAGSSTISATISGITGSAPLTVTPPPPSLPPVLDVSVTTKQSAKSRTISSPVFSTASPNELLVAFIASDGPGARGSQNISSVSGGGLTWTRRARANAQAGTAEIWQATTTNVVNNVVVTATRANGSYQGMITVAAFQGASLTTNGAAANASAASGAPTVSLVTTSAKSLVWGVGNDWDGAVVRTVSPNQTELSEFLAPAGDTFWVQYLTAPVATAGTTATISCTAPTNDRWNLAAIEIVPL